MHRQQGWWGGCQISERLQNSKQRPRAFESSQDLTIRRRMRYWIRPRLNSASLKEKCTPLVFCFIMADITRFYPYPSSLFHLYLCQWSNPKGYRYINYMGPWRTEDKPHQNRLHFLWDPLYIRKIYFPIGFQSLFVVFVNFCDRVTLHGVVNLVIIG